jgi:large subunit ribosomal protein L25
VDLPEGLTPTINDRDFTIATIVAPTVVRDEVASDGDDTDTEATTEDNEDNNEENSEE